MPLKNQAEFNLTLAPNLDLAKIESPQDFFGKTLSHWSSLGFGMDKEEFATIANIDSIQLTIRLAAFTVTNIFFEDLKVSVESITLDDADPEILKTYKDKLLELLEEVKNNFNSQILTEISSENLQVQVDLLDPEQIKTLQAIETFVKSLNALDRYSTSLYRGIYGIEEKISSSQTFIGKKENDFQKLSDPLENCFNLRESQKLESIIGKNKDKLDEQKESRKKREQKLSNFKNTINDFLTKHSNLQNLDTLIPEVSELLNTLTTSYFSNKELSEFLTPSDIELIANLILSFQKEKKTETPEEPKYQPPDPEKRGKTKQPSPRPRKKLFRQTLFLVIGAVLLLSYGTDRCNSLDTVRPPAQKEKKEHEPGSLDIKTTKNGWSPVPSITLVTTEGSLKTHPINILAQKVTPEMKKLIEQMRNYISIPNKKFWNLSPGSSEETSEYEKIRSALEKSLAKDITELAQKGIAFEVGEKRGFSFLGIQPDPVIVTSKKSKITQHYTGKFDGAGDIYKVTRALYLHVHFKDVPEWDFDLEVETEVTLQFQGSNDEVIEPIESVVIEPDSCMGATACINNQPNILPEDVYTSNQGWIPKPLKNPEQISSKMDIKKDNLDINHQSLSLEAFVDYMFKFSPEERKKHPDWISAFNEGRTQYEKYVKERLTERLHFGEPFFEGKRFYFSSHTSLGSQQDSLDTEEFMAGVYAVALVKNYEKEILPTQEKNTIAIIQKFELYFESKFDPLLNFTISGETSTLLTY
ncbi:hypothetical protein ACFL21_01065 [Patescibacteria group bacterium]